MNTIKIYSLGVVANWGYFNNQINKEARKSIINNKTYDTINHSKINSDIVTLTSVCAFLWPLTFPGHLSGKYIFSLK